MKTFIIVRTQFTALHNYPDCPIDSVYYLKYPHRHIFYVKLKVEVRNSVDRDIEFIDFKNKVDKFISTTFDGKDLKDTSCEKMCVIMIEKFQNISLIEISEDNENGIEALNDEK